MKLMTKLILLTPLVAYLLGHIFFILAKMEMHYYPKNIDEGGLGGAAIEMLSSFYYIYGTILFLLAYLILIVGYILNKNELNKSKQ